jgi:transposase
MIFGIFKRNRKVYTEIVPNVILYFTAGIRGKVILDSVIHSDGLRGYNGLVDLGYSKHFRIDHEQNQFVKERNHINGIKGF